MHLVQWKLIGNSPLERLHFGDSNFGPDWKKHVHLIFVWVTSTEETHIQGTLCWSWGCHLNGVITIPVNVVFPSGQSFPPPGEAGRAPVHWSTWCPLLECRQFYHSSPASPGCDHDLVPSPSRNWIEIGGLLLVYFTWGEASENTIPYHFDFRIPRLLYWWPF